MDRRDVLTAGLAALIPGARRVLGSGILTNIAR